LIQGKIAKSSKIHCKMDDTEEGPKDPRHPGSGKLWSQFAFIVQTSNCTKCNQLILMKIIKIVATRCRISRIKCTKFDFGWGSAPDPAEELTALPSGVWI